MKKDTNTQLKCILRKRALRFRYTAILALLTSIILMAVSIFLFLYAGELAYKDNVKVFKLENINLLEVKSKSEAVADSIKSTEALYFSFQEKLDTYIAKYQDEVDGNSETKRPGYGPVAKSIASAIDDTKGKLAIIQNQLANLQAKRDELDDEEKKLREIYQSKNLQPVKKSSNLSISQTISTSITRIIVMGSLLFLVQILINLYKYNVRVAGHFDSIADAIEIIPEKIPTENFTDLIEIMSTNSLDFGKTPNSSINSALELLKIIK